MYSRSIGQACLQLNSDALQRDGMYIQFAYRQNNRGIEKQFTNSMLRIAFA
jgi:hypothetical protein